MVSTIIKSTNIELTEHEECYRNLVKYCLTLIKYLTKAEQCWYYLQLQATESSTQPDLVSFGFVSSIALIKLRTLFTKFDFVLFFSETFGCPQFFSKASWLSCSIFL